VQAGEVDAGFGYECGEAGDEIQWAISPASSEATFLLADGVAPGVAPDAKVVASD